MKRAWMVTAMLLMGGMTATACGSSPSATPASTTDSPTYSGSPLAWLSSEARRWNKKLNDDQAAVVAAGAATGETDAATFFGRLATACTRLHDDARRAQQIEAAPSASLAAAWQGMADRTEAYASDCLTLTQTHSNAELTRWNDSLKAMNSANATLNSAVAAIRGTAVASGG